MRKTFIVNDIEYKFLILFIENHIHIQMNSISLLHYPAGISNNGLFTLINDTVDYNNLNSDIKLIIINLTNKIKKLQVFT